MPTEDSGFMLLHKAAHEEAAARKQRVTPARRTTASEPVRDRTSSRVAHHPPVPPDNPLSRIQQATGARKETLLSLMLLMGRGKITDDEERLTALGASGLDALARKMGREAAEEYADGASEVFDLDDLAPDDAELDDLYDEEPPLPAVGGLFYKQGLHILAAPGETGKTWLALGAMIPATPWEVDAGVSSNARPYGVYVDADGNGTGRMLVRAAQLGCGRDRVAAGDFRMLSLPDVASRHRCGRSEALAGIIAGLEAEDHLPEVVVFDSLTKLLAAEGIESNSDTGASDMLMRLNGLSERTCVIVIDHVGLSDGTRPRGSSAKRDAVDAVIMMSRLPPDPENHPDTEVAARLSASKDRHHGIRAALTAPGGDPDALGTWVLKRTGGYVDVGKRRRRREDRLSCEIISARSSAEKREREAANGARDKVAAAVAAAPGGEVAGYRNLVDILRADGMGKNAAEAAVTAAAEAGAVNTEKRGKAKVYTPAGAPQNVS